MAQARQFSELGLERLDLAQLAAFVRIDGPEFGAELLGLFFRREKGLHPFDADAVFILDLLDQFVCFREQKIGVEGKYTNIRAHARGNVDQRDVLRAKARRDGRVRMKLRKAPAQDFLGAPALRVRLHVIIFSCDPRSWFLFVFAAIRVVIRR